MELNGLYERALEDANKSYTNLTIIRRPMSQGLRHRSSVRASSSRPRASADIKGQQLPSSVPGDGQRNASQASPSLSPSRYVCPSRRSC